MPLKRGGAQWRLAKETAGRIIQDATGPKGGTPRVIQGAAAPQGGMARVTHDTTSPDVGASPASLQHLAEAVRIFVDVEAAALLFTDEFGQTIVGAVASQPGSPAPPAGVAMAADDLLLRDLAEGGPARTGAASDFEADHPFHGNGLGAIAVCRLVGSPASVVAVFSPARHQFSPAKLRSLRQVAAVAASDVTRARLADAERRSRLGASHARRHLALLANASVALSIGLDDWGPALDALCAEVVPVHADCFAIDIITADGSIQRASFAHADPAFLSASHGPASNDPRWASSMDRLLQDGTPIAGPGLSRSRRGDDADADAFGDADGLCSGLGLSSWAVLPIRTRGRSIGAITVGTIEPRRGLRPSDLAAYTELAARTAVTLERVLLYRKAQSAAETAEASATRLARAVQGAPAITASLTLPDLATEAARQTVRILGAHGASHAAVILYPLSGDRIVGSWHRSPIDPPTAARRTAELTAAADEGDAPGGPGAAGDDGQAGESHQPSGARERQPSVAGGKSWPEPDKGVRRGGGADPWLAVPINLGSVTAGGTLIVRGPSGHAFGNEEEAVLILLAQVTAAAVGAITDAANRVSLEREMQQTRRMEALGRLAGGVAHDFNNLLTVIVGYGDLLADKLGKDHPLFADVDAIRVAGKRASTFTEQLLTISRRRVVRATDVDLNRAIQELSDVLRRLIGTRIELRTELHPAAGTIHIDAGQLDQVILNLVINARDAITGGGVITIISSIADGAESGDGHSTVLSVRDSGVGMDAPTIEHCFEPFFTAGRPGKGTGLGLATVYGIVREAGATIAVDSSPGQGTTFVLSFPRPSPATRDLAGAGATTDAGATLEQGGATSEQAGVTTPEPVGATALAGAHGRSPRAAAPVKRGPGAGTILVVEDEPGIRSFAQAVLTGAGFAVQVAGNATEALAAAASLGDELDLLLTDVVMPGVDGPELARMLCAGRPGLPVLFVSGYVDDRQRERLASQPNSRLLAKPFRPAELIAAVGTMLDQRNAMRRLRARSGNPRPAP